MAYRSKSERGQKAEARLLADPYDTESWNVLLREAQSLPIASGRALYERLVERFPTCGRYWRLYIEQEMKAKNYENIEQLFQRCLMKVLNVDLWKSYLHYVKETKGSLPTFRDKMTQAFEFALDKVGLDFNCYQIWADYIAFLKAGEASGSFAENQKIMNLRKVYQRAVFTPINNLESLWRDYTSFEQSVNKVLAKKLIDEKTREYMNARRAAKEYEAITRNITRGNPSVPPQGTPSEMKQLNLWNKYLQWEKSNPLKSEDMAVLTKRVMYAFEQALLALSFYPNIWYQAALFLEDRSRQLFDQGDQQNGKIMADEANAIYERATSTHMKFNVMLHFAWADFLESQMKVNKAKDVYENLLSTPNIDHTLIYIQFMKFSRRSEGIKESRAVFKRAREDTRCCYHVFVAAALMEYYITKDKVVSMKIFELGLKKFANEAKYILAYLEFLIHLNDDNNTRVLFERVLSNLPQEKSREIFKKFLDFEANSGDLASYLKVEKRKLSLFKEELESRETTLLVDRYRYLDLYPCTKTELAVLGYETQETEECSQTSTSLQGSLVDETMNLPTKFPAPNLSQMSPFKPVPKGTAGVHHIPGGVFPVPPAAAHLISLMPPPMCFQGPFVMVDELLKMIADCHLQKPQTTSLPEGSYNGGGIRSESMIVEDARGKKRSLNGNDSDDEEKLVSLPPVNDIYRMRQQKKVAF
ncbi:cleavage stimulation factor subunit 3-like [Xenia sp. Carnegie-2017]|uniref:cleavage stimulation factor subunit 3-like n=1 Tax=Xenia sp. Carnegie-2017 TaxID=2897299 RepID=UPI001F03A76D|nr:cleavage stimulation factor subunit 3-like [Xenia sp. Carnegie-2017]XP_046843996.1 cleavage stimulation factor subunit 3-like [Xenia sp. Carnegie-2017]